MRKYTVSGMSCAACSARVEKAVSKLQNVTQCSVNLLTNSMTVYGTASDLEIINAVKNAGYDAFLPGEKPDEKIKSDSDRLLLRLISSLLFLLALMYFSMGNMWGLPIPKFLNPTAVGIIQLLLCLPIIVINKSFFISGFRGLINRAPNMDTLVSLGSGVSFIYSTYLLFKMTVLPDTAGHILHGLYFESAAMILVLITVGKFLEARSKGKTTDALKSLISLTPDTALVLIDGKEVQIPAKNLKKDDIFLVKPGAKIPCDGVVLDGVSAVSEAALTGEYVPVDKEIGDTVSAATTNLSGFLKCRATHVGEDTSLAKIIKMVSEASSGKAPVSRLADKVSGIFVPTVMGISAVTFLIWLISGADFAASLTHAITVLVISCPCALGLATPVAIMVSGGMGAKHGILFKTAASLEETGRAKIVALDKTGTITEGKPVVTDIIPYKISENELMQLAYSIEAKSEHPLAKAVVQKAEELGIALIPSENFEAHSGSGVTATIGGASAICGNCKFVSKAVSVPDELKSTEALLSDDGKTPLFFAKGDTLAGIIAVSDKIKEDSPRAVSELKKMGIKVVMLTGDNYKTASAVKQQTNVDEVIAELLPGGKQEAILELKKQGKTIMVGDGINDAPALTSADIGIAIGRGTDVAIDSADVVLVKSRLTDVVAAIRLSRYTLKNIRENLFWAFIYNIIGIPLAAGVFTRWGLSLSPIFGAAAMSISSVSVVLNALRINLFNIYGEKVKEKKSMEKIIKIEGMMCPHCEARVKSALEGIDGVLSAAPSHTEKSAVVTLSKDIPEELLKSAVENSGYQAISIS